MYFPKGRVPDDREWPDQRGLSRQYLDGLHKRKYVPNKSPMYAFSKYADVCIDQGIKFTDSGGFYASGPILSSTKK